MVGDSRFGSQLIRCNQCGHSFTRTNWLLHGHNPSQTTCHKCRRKAVGHSLRLLLCSEHLVEALRKGNEVTFVDGRACGVCEGHGIAHGQEIGPDPGGKWVRCAHCQGSGYDPELRQDRVRRLNRHVREKNAYANSRKPNTAQSAREKKAAHAN